ncbi:MAG: PD-(D/E)XK nuclease family protein [Anaerolineae bacterium]|nr:PD-(D/E)XK nuclease family protein [Anaerolineae bacterium]
MTTHLYLAPAGCGKTAYVVDQARQAATRLQAMPRICVASPLQRWALRRRIADAGGAIGIRTALFSDLYHELLQTAAGSGESYTLLSDPVQYRLLRTLVQALDLRYFAQLVDRPGFIQMLQQLIAEFKGARIDPAALARVLPPENERLTELALVYTAYQKRLQEEQWADRAGMGWLAVEALEQTPRLGEGWQTIYFDGFDSFTATQRAFLQALQKRVGALVITLTGEPDGEPRRAHTRFAETRRVLEAALSFTATALPARKRCDEPGLRHLEGGLFERSAEQQAGGHALRMLAAADRAGEVREALRWLKEMHLQTGLPLHHFALLARDLEPYAPFVAETAASFGLPIYAPDGPPLARNPLVAAILELLRLVLPTADGETGYALPRAAVVAAWRSPYFDWAKAVLPGAEEAAIGIEPRDAEALDEVARRGRVVGGESQWKEALQAEQRRAAAVLPDYDDDAPQATERVRPDLLPKFEAFLARLRPPQRATYREYVAWLEGLIGDDPQGMGPESVPPAQSLQVIAYLAQGDEAAKVRDRAALLALKEVLRGLVVAEAALSEPEPVSYSRFFQELAGAIDASFLAPAGDPDGAIIVANVLEARGLPFAAVAVLGLGEGSFPATVREDPFLRETDRDYLREAGLRLESSVISREREYFYETVTRPWQRLMLVRGRLADDGALWEPSPYWAEVQRLVAVEPEEQGSQDVVLPQRAASHAELLQALVAHRLAAERYIGQDEALWNRWQLLQRAAAILRQRYQGRAGRYDGDLGEMASTLRATFGQGYEWSASQIETYLSCAHRFLCERALALRPRPSGDFSLDAAQLGSIYHAILQQVYEGLPEPQRTDVEAVTAALDEVAPRVLEAAPTRYGFRPTAWWAETRAEITETLRKTLVELAAAAGEYVPASFEHYFGKQRPLWLRRDGEAIRLSGFIDRIDRDGGNGIRIVDYKSAGAQGYNKRSLVEGEHVQLPLYALAAEQALGMGTVSDGFYWHVRDARPSPLRLSAENLEEAVSQAINHTWDAVDGVRAGAFVPTPPRGSCPDFCSAAAFCWHFKPRFRR